MHDVGKYRKLGRLHQDNREDFIDFSTNDYLALSRNSQVIEAATNALHEYGVGSTGSRLLSGNTFLHEEFKKRIAKNKHTEASLIFNSGFQANISVLSSLLDEKILGAKPIVFFDRLNHSSLYQAIFLAKAELHRYRHLDMDHLESLLNNHQDGSRPKFIVTGAVFGMDGDVVNLEQIAKLSRTHKAFLYLDEAHAIGLFGQNGYGLSTTINMHDIPRIVMGTFSKAIGSSGGYIACSNIIHDFLINKAAGFIYSTPPSPASIGAAYKAWEMIEDLNEERTKLNELSKFLREKLKELGFNVGNSTTHIIPIILGEEKLCLKVKEELLEDKIIVSAIRPPTVPPNSSRLRIALTVTHKPEDIERLLDSLRKKNL